MSDAETRERAMLDQGFAQEILRQESEPRMVILAGRLLVASERLAASVERERQREEWWAEKHLAEQRAAMRLVEAGVERERQLEEALRKFGRHQMGCKTFVRPFPECSCGLDAALSSRPGPTANTETP
jgi:hypothetical protein